MASNRMDEIQLSQEFVGEHGEMLEGEQATQPLPTTVADSQEMSLAVCFVFSLTIPTMQLDNLSPYRIKIVIHVHIDKIRTNLGTRGGAGDRGCSP